MYIKKLNFQFRRLNIFSVLYFLALNAVKCSIWKICKRVKGIDYPVIHLYTASWNEEKMLPHFINHYSRFVSHIYIYDNESDDNTDELLSQYKNVTVKKYSTGNTFKTDSKMKIHNHAYKNSIGKADWVIVCDVDEFVYYPDNLFNLLENTRTTVFQCKGVEMFSDVFPDNYNDLLIHQVKNGVYSHWLNKSVLFNPYKIININYASGAYSVIPYGIIHINMDSLLLLHFKNLSLDYVLARIHTYRKRMSQENIERGHGVHYRFTDEKIKDDFERNRNEVKIIPELNDI